MQAGALRTEQFSDTAQLHERQVRYDLQTQFAELVDGTMRTEFELYFDGHDLISEDGRSLDKTTRDALEEAKQIVRSAPELWFEIRRRDVEREEFEEQITMARGEGPNTMVVISDFPAELVGAPEDVGGYNVTRQQAMLRILTRQANGNIRMYSQTLDGSNRQGLEAIYNRFNVQPEPGELLGQRLRADLSPQQQLGLVDELRGTYDRTLAGLHGGEWYAGRRPADTRNTYDFVCRQQDLISECMRLDKLGWLNRDVMYKVAAAMQKRFEVEEQTTAPTVYRPHTTDPAILYELHQEIDAAGAEAEQAGVSFSACGDTLGARHQLEQAGYGNKTKAGEDKFGPLRFKCTEGHFNIRPYGKLIDKCQHHGCKGTVGC